MQRKYTKEFLGDLIQNATSMREVLDKLNISLGSGTASHIYRVVKKLGIDTSHFVKCVKQDFAKYPIEDYFSGKRRISSAMLRNRLFNEGIKEKKCEKCGIVDWNGQYLGFELHHIDENRENNALSNLLIVCPNCHYCIHNKGKTEKDRVKRRREYDRKRRVIKQPDRSSTRKVVRPSLIEIQEKVESIGYSATGRFFGVSDNAIRKWLKFYTKYPDSK